MTFYGLLFITYLIWILFLVILVISENRNPLRTLSWILVLTLLPVAGALLYLFFGQNFRKKRILSKKRFPYSKTAFQHDSTGEYKPISSSLTQLLFNNDGSIRHTGNDVKILRGGNVTFEAMLSDIASAKEFIHMEFYIIENDNIGRKFHDLLIKKANEGVDVRIIFDDVGSWHLKRKHIRELQLAGAEVYPFLEVRFPYFTSKINYRNHRKTLIVDRQIGYTGSVNLADQYANGTEGSGWYDLHIRIAGPAVNALQEIFLEDWYFSSRLKLSKEIYLSEIPHYGEKTIQTISSGPDSPWLSIMQAFFFVITRAQKFVYITTPYLMPTESILEALKVSALSGVDVRIIIPHKSDTIITDSCSRSYVDELLKANIKVYLYSPGFIHSKLLITDEITSIGTANLDFRSFEGNFESSTFIYDKDIIMETHKVFLNLVQYSEQLHLQTWKKRSRTKKIKESLARLLSPLL